MESVNKILMTRNEKLNLNEATDILKKAEKGEYNNDISIRIPVAPTSGEVILYRKKSMKDTDYRCDQYVWRNRGTSKYHTSTLETFYNIVSEKTKKPLPGFAKRDLMEIVRSNDHI
jgi:CG-1 domain